MRRTVYLMTIVMTAMMMVACNRGGNKRSSLNIFTPTSSGRAYELLVVCDDANWEGVAGRALYDVLDTDVPGLPQPERSFRIMNTTPYGYNATLKMLRNIIKVDIDPSTYTQPKFRSEMNVYSNPQAILTIQGPDAESVAEYVTKNGQAIINFFTRAEMNRQIQVLEYQHSDMIYKSVKEMFDCDVWVSGELKSSKRGENFFWAGANAASGDQNYVIYSYPYKDRRTFTQDFFIQKRDSVMKINIPGAAEGTYMATDARFVTTRSFMMRGEYIFEARGLWKVKGDMMGGPFVSQSRVDTVNQRVITEEIFIYAPEKLKRNLVRGMEAALYTIKLPGKQTDETQIPLQDE